MKNRARAGMSRAAIALAAGALLLAAGPARAETRTWTGLGADNLASTPENWLENTRPTSMDHIVLDATTNKNMTWDAGVNGLPDTVASWTQAEQYTGTVTFLTLYGASGFTNFTVNGNVVIEGGSWTHAVNGSSETNRLCVTVNGSLTLGSSGRVDVLACGYAAGQGPGGATDRAGGGHGGQGGRNYNGVGRGVINGSLANPTSLGSGGSGTAGGGAVRLAVTNALVVNGTISAAGQALTGFYGGGAGGSIWITAGSLTGSGSINADGGQGGHGGGGGGGGRIAVEISGADSFGGVTFSVLGGARDPTSVNSDEPGAAGTVFLKGANDLYGHLRVNAGGLLTSSLTLLATGTNRFNSITLTNGAVFGATDAAVLDLSNGPTIRTYGGSVPLPGRLILRHGGSAITGLEGLWSDGVMSGAYTLSLVGTNALVWNDNLTLTNGAVLTHERNLSAASLSHSVNLSVQGDLTVATGAVIRTDFLGQGPGTGSGRGGFGHGGRGGRDWSSSTSGGPTYGSITAPTHAGSSAGGGVVRLEVTGALAVNGTIDAVGQTPTTMIGGGSGGSIWISANSMAGAGSVNAVGGQGGHAGGGGGGGRIAVQLTGSDSSGGVSFSAAGGPRNTDFATTEHGAAGTVYIETQGVAPGAGTVTVNNGSRANSIAFTALPAFSTSAESIANTSWVTTNNARIGLTTNARIASLTLNPNGSLELAGRTLTTLALTVNGTVYRPGTYTPAEITQLTDGVGGGKVELIPAVDNADGATGVTTAGATLNGNLLLATESTALFVLWGPSDAGTNVAQWAHTNMWPAPVSAGAFSTNLTAPELVANTVYYYRFYTTNSIDADIATESSAFMTSEVTVQQTADADEDGLIPGRFLLSRHPDATNGALTVTYSIGGSAQVGVNYVDNLGTGITFAEGAAEAELVVTPLQDDASQVDETVILTLDPGPYPLGSPAVDTVVILNVGYPKAPTNAWIGSGSASIATNWSLGHAPTTGEDVLLRGFSKSDLVWDIDGGVASWTQTEQYTGTVTFLTRYGATDFTNFTVNGNVVIEGGSWTHAVNGSSEANRLCVTVNGSLTLGSSGRVDVSACGYAADQGPGKATAWRAGGGHGGQGGRNYQAAGRGAINGSLANPASLGSGGSGTAGGGAVRLVVTNALVINGTIRAVGQAGKNYDGGGSGGSIWISAGLLTGSGSINADGGQGATGGGGGGGGRIAVDLSGADSFDGVTFSALGGTKGSDPLPEPGAAGTVFLKGANDLYGHLRVNAGERLTTSLTLLATGTNQFNSITLTNGAVFGATGAAVLDLSNTPTIRTYGGSVPLPGRLILRHGGSAITGLEGLWSDGVMSGAYTLSLVGTNALVWNGNLTLTNGAVLTHERNLSAAGLSNSVNLSVQGDLTVATNAVIRTDFLGYAAGQGPGTGSDRGGAGHGGRGGRDYQAKGSGGVYGSVVYPANAGSSLGGGVVRLEVTGALTVNGTIRAVGQMPTTMTGGGSGGSIWISANSMAGAGSVNADGGKGGHAGGGGGGGRIAVQLTGSASAGGVSFSAAGGPRDNYTGTEDGAAGTVYIETQGVAPGAGTVTVDNGSHATNTSFTALPAFSTSTEIIANTSWVTTNNARIGMTTNTTIARLTLNPNGTLELAGHTLTTLALTVNGAVYRPGIYTAAEITQLTDGVGGGQVVVYAPKGTLFLMR